MNNSTEAESFERTNQFTSHLYPIFDLLVNCVFINIVAPFGAAGNGISIVVLSRHDVTQNSTNILLISLAVSDFLFLVSIPIRRCKCIVYHTTNLATAITADTLVHQYILIPNYAFLGISFTMVTLIAIQRFVAVYFPFKVRTIFTPWKMKMACAISYLLIGIMFVPYAFALTHDWIYEEKLNATIAVLSYTEFFMKNSDAINAFYYLFVNIVYAGTCLVLVLALSVAIAVRMSRVNKERKNIVSKATGTDPKVVKMLLVVCGVAVIVLGPTTLNDAYMSFIPNVTETYYFDMSHNVSEILYTIHSSSNFLIYVTMSSRFSIGLKSLLRCQKKNIKNMTSRKETL